MISVILCRGSRLRRGKRIRRWSTDFARLPDVGTRRRRKSHSVGCWLSGHGLFPFPARPKCIGSTRISQQLISSSMLTTCARTKRQPRGSRLKVGGIRRRWSAAGVCDLSVAEARAPARASHPPRHKGTKASHAAPHFFPSSCLGDFVVNRYGPKRWRYSRDV